MRLSGAQGAAQVERVGGRARLVRQRRCRRSSPAWSSAVRSSEARPAAGSNLSWRPPRTYVVEIVSRAWPPCAARPRVPALAQRCGATPRPAATPACVVVDGDVQAHGRSGSTGKLAIPLAEMSDHTARRAVVEHEKCTGRLSMPSAIPSSSPTSSCGVSFTAPPPTGPRAQALVASDAVIAVRPAQRGSVDCLRLIGRDVANQRQHRGHDLPAEPVVQVVPNRGVGGARGQVHAAAILEIALHARTPRVEGLPPEPQCRGVRLGCREGPRAWRCPPCCGLALPEELAQPGSLGLHVVAGEAVELEYPRAG